MENWWQEGRLEGVDSKTVRISNSIRDIRLLAAATAGAGGVLHQVDVKAGLHHGANRFPPAENVLFGGQVLSVGLTALTKSLEKNKLSITEFQFVNNSTIFHLREFCQIETKDYLAAQYIPDACWDTHCLTYLSCLQQKNLGKDCRRQNRPLQTHRISA